MSDSDGIGSPGRQRRSSERSRENIREYVKLLGRKVQDASPDRKSPISVSDEKSPLRGSPSKSSPEEEKKGSPKVRRGLFGCAKSLEKDKEIESPIKKESHSLSEKKDEEKGELSASRKSEDQENKITLNKDQCGKGNLDNTSAIGEKATKLQKGERRSSSDSKKTPVKVDKTEESSDDSPPDLVLFLKEGRGRTQNWSEPPTLDAESIATRSRTRVPADLNLQFVKKSKPQDNVKVKGKELKKEFKKEKSKVLETPESLKRLAQSIPLKEPRRSSISQENESAKNIPSGKGKTKVASVKECGNSKGKRDDSENSMDEKGKVNTRTRLTRKDSNSSLSDTSGSDPTEDKVGVLKRGLHIKKNVTDGGKAHKESAAVNISGVSPKEGSDDDQTVTKKKEEGNESVKGIDQDEKKSEYKIKSAVRSSTGVKTPEELSSGATLAPVKMKKLTILPEKKNFEKELTKIEMKVASETVKICEDDKRCKSAEGDIEKGEAFRDSGVQEESGKRAEIRVTRSIIKPLSTSEEAVNNQGTVLMPTLPVADKCCVTLESEQEKQVPVKVSNLVTIAAANPGNGAPVRYRKIHIKIPSLQQSQANKIESPIFIGNTEVMTFKGESVSQTSQMPTKEVRAKQASEENVLSTPEKTAPHNDSSLSDSDFSLRLSPTPQKVTLYDLTDIEAEEVVVGDGGSSSESSLPGSCKESESSIVMDQVPQQQQSQDMNLLSNEVLDSSSEDDSSKSGEGTSTLKKSLLLSPEGKVALDHSYSSGTSEGSKGSSSTKKKSPMSHEKTLSPRPVYSSASLAKRPLDIMMHNDKINILRQMSQIFNNEKPNEDDGESEEDARSEGKDLALGVKNRCVPMKGDSSKNRMIKSQGRQLVSIKSSASYVLTPDKSLVKSPSKVLLVEPSPSYVKDLQKDFNSVSNSKNQESQRRDGVKDDHGKSHSKQIKDQDAAKKEESEVGVVQEMNQKEGKKVEKAPEKVTEDVKVKKMMENVKMTKDLNSCKKVVTTSLDTPDTLKKDIANQKSQDSCKKNEKHKVVEETSKKNSVELNKEQPSTKKDTLQQKVPEDNVEKSNKKQEKEDLKESSKNADHSDVPKEDKGMLDKKETAQKSDTNLSGKNSIGKGSSCSNSDEKVSCVKEGIELPKRDEELVPLSSGRSDVMKRIEASGVPKVFLSPIKGEPFIGFPDKIPKVHHVSSYATSLNENIQVESSVGPKGEAIDIIDGFTFISFNTEEEMMKYSRRVYNKTQKTFRRLRKKKGKARKFSRVKKHSTPVQKSSTSSIAAERPRRETQGHPGERNAAQSSAFASNDLDAFLDNCSRLNISYAIPKCKATEDGVTKITDEFLEGGDKKSNPPAEQQDTSPSIPDPATTPQEEQSAVAPQNDDAASDSVQQYEEVNAIDILYPKEKYKYYYNKELCKESKGDGSTLFVHRAGQLVPLNSVFKTQKTAPPVTVSRKTVELIYIYDGGKLLTLGGSLTKINPSNSDSVRARVVLPMGTPCIPKGQSVDSSKKQVKAVEINEDMAKFALSALQEPFTKESDGKDSPQASSQASAAVPVEKDFEKSDSKEKEKSEDKKKGKTWPKLPVKPNKSNILDIIAAKLAMSEDESDEKDEEAKESKEDDVKMESDKGKSNSPDTIEKDNRDTEEADKKIDNPQTSEEDSKDVKVPDESSDLKIPKEDLEMSSHKDETVGEGSSRNSGALKDEQAEEMDTKGGMNSKDCKWSNLKAESCSDEMKEEKKNIETLTKAGAEESKESPLMSDQKQQDGRDEDQEGISSKDHQESDMKDEANLKDVRIQSDEKDKLACLDEKPSLELEKNDVKEETGPSKSSDDDTKLSASQSEVSEGTSERKDDESSSDTADSGEKAVNGLTANKSKVFKKNMYRFPSLSREMKRLSMNFVNYVGETTEQPEAVKIDPNATCTNDFCKLGCVCETLLCTRKDPEHCGRIECMFECTCRDESWKHPVSGSGRTMNAVSIFNVDREQMEGLAVREKDFRRTVIQTGSEVILVGAERKKRERRLPDRFKDSAMWSGSDYVTLDTAEAETPTVKEEYPSIPLHEAAKYIKKCSVKVPWYDIKGISVWCMAHSCYDCKCFTDPSFFAASDEISPMVPLDETSNADTKASVDQVKVKEEACLEPSCVVVNIDVNNVQARRRYCWRLKEWYHPVENHSSRTCGYSSSKKRLCEETKQLTITGQSSQENSPEQLVENVVRSLRYEKSREYSQGGIVLPYYDTFGGVSPAKLKKIVQLQNRNNVESIKSENSPESVPVVDLTSEIVEESKDTTGSKTQLLKPLSKPEDSVRKRSSSFEGKSAMLVKKRRLTEPEDVSESTKFTKTDDAAEKSEPSKCADNIRQAANIISEQDERKSLVANKELLKKNKEVAGSNEEVSSARRPLSLVEMMIAEEKRGELELDLSDKTPGNALLVAESRFRKLINMNIIGVIGINKAGRCIISTVDSALCLRTMTNIHTMISNNSLDVGPNMREIFFPAAHAAPRQRFVMIRCDAMKKWEIVGVVQKKGALGFTKKPSEQKNKSASSQKVAPAQPQVIDLEDEEEQNSTRMNKTDIVELPGQKDISPADELESCIERSNSSWEGSFPQIASVQGASDVHIPGAEGQVHTEVVDNFEIVSTDVGTGAVEETSTPVTSLPNLIPLAQNSTDQVSVEKPASTTDKLPVVASKSPSGNSPTSVFDSEKTNSEKSPNVVSGTIPVASSPQLYFLPTVYSSSTTTVTTNFSSSPITSVSGMRMIKLNQSSAKVFGEPSGNSFLPVTPISYQSPQSALTGAPPLNATSTLVSRLTTTSTSASSMPSNPSLENVVVCPVSDAKRIGLSSVFRPLDVQKSPDLKTPVPTNPQGFQRPMYFAPNPGGMPRMVLMPPQKGVPPQVLAPNTSKNQDVQFKRMLLVPSTTESGRMVLISMPTTLANEPAVSGADEGTGVVSVSSSSKVPKTDSSVEQGSNSDVQILSTVKPSVLPPPPPLRNMSSTGKREKMKDSTCDDVVILNAPSNNTLTISKVESLSQGKVPGSSSSAQVLPTNNSNTRVASTTIVMSSTTISSTLPLITPSSYTEASSKEVSDGQSLPIKSSSDVSVQEKAIEKSKASEPSTSGISTDNPIIEYETIRSPEKRVKCDEDLKKSPAIKEAKKDTVSEGTDDIQELKVTPPQIKKGGHHWSAVDLSLSFKSVKLEWLLGTIRQNVLVNIYRLSLKTQSPVTLSVKNGTSMSTLYGLARKSYFDPVEQKCLPVLILGSVMSAVISSASTDDSMLFKANAIKYFIRESTGELASYTYDSSGKSLIKLASKKRAATGEMIGIGETISLHSVRDTKYLGSSQTPVKNNDSSKGSQGSDCSCITAGNFICLGHKTAGDEKPPVSESSCFQGLSDSFDEKSSSQGSVIGSLQPKDKLKSESSDQKTLSSKSLKQSEPETILNQAIETSSNIVESSQISKNLESATTVQSSNHDCEIVCVKSSKTKNFSVENKSSTSEWLNTKSKRNDQHAVEGEDVIDIESFCDEESIITNLRDQMVVLNKMMALGKSERPMMSSNHGVENVLDIPVLPPCSDVPLQIPAPSFATAVERLTFCASDNKQGFKEKKESGFDRPCPLSRKKGKESISQMRKSSTLFPAKPKEVDSRQRVPLQLAQVKATDLQDSHMTVDDSHPGPSGVGTSRKQKSSWLGAPVQKIQRKEQKFVDIEGTEERSTLVHNELERMRRRALRVLFLNLGNAISHCEKDPSGNCYKAQSKIFILKKASEIAQNLLHQSLKLNKLEMCYRRERSKLIQKLASAIRDKDEDVKKGWKSWVEEHMKNPSAKETFEKTWKPVDMEKEIMALSSNESSIDIDTDEGSPLSAPSSPVPGAWTAYQQKDISSLQTRNSGLAHAATSSIDPTNVFITPDLNATYFSSLKTLENHCLGQAYITEVDL
ncbi:microtubule-associated protein futsch-like isoform X4 [Macrobrachium rosenbergii]|uniref:microtubule-associated protein futsch-like isoform X4 n=1 Tax=Macrobrachium rosenbergii TaxID=79674 RepID=UPI0034D505CF